MEASEILKGMLDAAPQKVVSNSTALNQIDSDIASLSEQANAIVTGMMNPIAASIDHHLNHIWDTTNGDYIVTLGPTYNVNSKNGTVTDWVVTDSTTGDIVYQYMGIGWDGDEHLITNINSWNWALDYLWRDMGFSGTYGIYDKIAKLQMSRGVIQSDLSKHAQSITEFSQYAST